MNELRRAVEMDIGDLIGIVTRRWRLFLLLACVSGLLAFGASFLMTPRYHAYASILPSRGFMREQQIVLTRSELGSAVALRPTTASNSINLVIGASYALREKIVTELGLVDFFDLSREARKDSLRAVHEAVDELRKITHFELSIYRDVLFIHVMCKDPEYAADIANAYVRLIQVENSNFYRMLAEKSGTELREQLTRLRDSLKEKIGETEAYYVEHGLRNIDMERRQTFSLLESLMFEQQRVTMALARARLDQKEGAPEVAELKALAELYSRVMELSGLTPGDGKPGESVAVFDVATVLAAEKLHRELKELESFENSLAMQLAAARMEADISEIRLPVMDRAFPPAEAEWPRRWLLTLGFFFLIPALVWLGLLHVELRRLGAESGT